MAKKNLFPIMEAKKELIWHELEAYLAVHYPGYSAIITDTVRTAKEQFALYKRGRFGNEGAKVTNCDGYIRKSNHQSGLAFDMAFLDPKRRLVYNVAKDLWEYYGHLCRKHGLEWGGNWKSFKDSPHAEWPKRDKKTYALARNWIKENGYDE